MWLLRQGDAGCREAIEESEVWSLAQLQGWAVCGPSGFVYAIGGFAEHWPGRALAWTYISRRGRGHLRQMTEFVRATLDDERAPRRIEAGVRCGFDAGARWAAELGFDLETPCARAWAPDGADFQIWVRVK